MKKILVLLMLISSLHAAPWRTLRRVGEGLLGAATAADINSSRGLVEENPLVGRGAFGVRQSLLIGGATVGAIVVQEIVTHRYPQLNKVFTFVNLGAASVHVYCVKHNYREQR